jgi:hypothetical protein
MFDENEYKYENLSHSAEDGSVNRTRYAPSSRYQRLKVALLSSSTPWIISTFVFAILSGVLAINPISTWHQVGSFAHGFTTDIGKLAPSTCLE